MHVFKVMAHICLTRKRQILSVRSNTTNCRRRLIAFESHHHHHLLFSPPQFLFFSARFCILEFLSVIEQKTSPLFCMKWKMDKVLLPSFFRSPRLMIMFLRASQTLSQRMQRMEFFLHSRRSTSFPNPKDDHYKLARDVHHGDGSIFWSYMHIKLLLLRFFIK